MQVKGDQKGSGARFCSVVKQMQLLKSQEELYLFLVVLNPVLNDSIKIKHPSSLQNQGSSMGIFTG